MRTPTQREALDRVLADLRADLHTTFPARVLAYDAAAQTLDLRPALLREIPSDDPDQPWGFERMPDLYGVPIRWPRAGGFVITFPILEGDWVKVDCAEQSTLRWRETGDAPSHPGVSDPHGLNGMVADVGWYPDVQKAASVSTTDFVIGKPDGTRLVRITPGGDVYLGAGPHLKLADEDWVKAELTAIATTLASVVDASFGSAYAGPGDANITKTRGT